MKTEVTLRQKMIMDIFLKLNSLRRYEGEGYKVHFRKWQWYVNDKPVEPEAMRDSVFAYVDTMV